MKKTLLILSILTILILPTLANALDTGDLAKIRDKLDDLQEQLADFDTSIIEENINLDVEIPLTSVTIREATDQLNAYSTDLSLAAEDINNLDLPNEDQVSEILVLAHTKAKELSDAIESGNQTEIDQKIAELDLLADQHCAVTGLEALKQALAQAETEIDALLATNTGGAVDVTEITEILNKIKAGIQGIQAMVDAGDYSNACQAVTDVFAQTNAYDLLVQQVGFFNLMYEAQPFLTNLRTSLQMLYEILSEGETLDPNQQCLNTEYGWFGWYNKTKPWKNKWTEEFTASAGCAQMVVETNGVKRGWIKLNGEKVIGPGDFDKDVSTFYAFVDLKEENELKTKISFPLREGDLRYKFIQCGYYECGTNTTAVNYDKPPFMKNDNWWFKKYCHGDWADDDDDDDGHKWWRDFHKGRWGCNEEDPVDFTCTSTHFPSSEDYFDWYKKKFSQDTYVETFSATPGCAEILVESNGKVKSAIVDLNGHQVFVQQDFDKGIRYLQNFVELEAENTLTTQVLSPYGAKLRVGIAKCDSTECGETYSLKIALRLIKRINRIINLALEEAENGNLEEANRLLDLALANAYELEDELIIAIEQVGLDSLANIIAEYDGSEEDLFAVAAQYQDCGNVFQAAIPLLEALNEARQGQTPSKSLLEYLSSIYSVFVILDDVEACIDNINADIEAGNIPTPTPTP